MDCGYDWFGNNTAITATISGLTPLVRVTQEFDVAGNRHPRKSK